MGRAAQLANSTAATLQRLRQDGAGALLMPGAAPSAAVPAAAERLAESAGRGEQPRVVCRQAHSCPARGIAPQQL